MSLQPIDILDAKHKAICEREAKHTSKKQNALRELLVNHHTVRIKPIKVEQSNRLQSFFDRNSLSSFEPEPKKEIKNVPVNNVSKEPVKNAVSETGASKLSTLNSKMMEAILRPTPQLSESQPMVNLNKFVSNIPESSKPSTPAVPVSIAVPKSTHSDKIANQSPLVTALLQNKSKFFLCIKLYTMYHLLIHTIAQTCENPRDIKLIFFTAFVLVVGLIMYMIVIN